MVRTIWACQCCLFWYDPRWPDTHTLVVGAHIEWENRSHLTFRLVCLPKGTEENSVEFTGFRWNAPPGIFCHQCTSSFCDDSIENRSSLSKWYFHRLESCTPNSSCLLVFRRETFRVFCLLWLAPSIDCGNCRKGLSAPNVPCVFVCVCPFVWVKFEVQLSSIIHHWRLESL